MEICGIDEAGRGPVIGPMIICGVCVSSDSALREIGVKDSKKLTPRRREELAAKIRSVTEVEVVEVPAEEIDVMREMMTINELEARIFAAIIERLAPDVAYVDSADANEAQFGRVILAKLQSKPRIFSRHKADEIYPVVSAASIVAKVRRDERIREIEQELGTQIGSGYPADPTTVAFLKKWVAENGSCPPHTRRSWGTAQNIMNLNSLRKLDSFEG